jgi:hypothetical protein
MMMKKFAFVLCFFLALMNLAAQSSNSPQRLEMSFVFNRQGGFSTNQYAIWIEDSKGNLVKTLFASKFTASGGWAKRPASIPLWVQKSGLSRLDKKDIDAFTGATPKAGTQKYSWDGLDKSGNRISGGEYRVFLEATLRDENRVVYSASFVLSDSPENSGQREADVKSEYFGSRTNERNMIENVKVVFR